MNDLFDRWERVWHESQYDLIAECVGDTYIRHDVMGDRTVTREAYAAELMNVHRQRLGIRVIVYDHSFVDDRAWFRFSFKWNDQETGDRQSQAGMQVYRIEAGKLAETWVTVQPLGSGWSDEIAQEHWTSEPPTSAEGRSSPSAPRPTPDIHV